MPRVPRPWFRAYTEMFGDRKIRRLTPAQRWVWVAIMGAARESPEPGRLLIARGIAMTAAELADYADVPRRSIRPAIDAMRALGMLHMDSGGVLVVTNWAHRQYESDVSTSRTRAHRSRVDNPEIPGLEAPVGTFQPRSYDRSNPVPTGVPGTAVGTDQRTETETDTEPEVNPGGNRYVSRRARNTTPPPEEPTCTRHPDGDTGEACAGCARRNEWREQQKTARRNAARTRRETCPDCHGDIWLPDGTKCTHPNGRRTA